MKPLKTLCFALLAANAIAQTNDFELATVVYDTDPAVHLDFGCAIYQLGVEEGNGPNTRGPCAEGPEAYKGAGGNLKPNCLGIVKGLVKPTLNPATRKIEYSGDDPKGCWTSEEWFNTAFSSKPGFNVQHCYSLPFTKTDQESITECAITTDKECISKCDDVPLTQAEYKECIDKCNISIKNCVTFDSDKMLNKFSKLVGGLFLPVLNEAPDDPDCPSCNTKRTAERFIPFNKVLTKGTFDSYKSKEEDFKDGDTPTLGEVLGTASRDALYDWSARDTASWFLYGNTKIKNQNSYEYDPLAKANQHFCFESHANFVYDPEQIFYITGDDALWVYINNKLVIDLGGKHMPAPDHVNLNTLELTEGETYPLDIFFCDRFTQQATLRISTNIPLKQTPGGTCVSTPTPPTAITHSPASNIKAMVKSNAILLENLPAKAKIELYNLQGKRIYSTNSENSKILRILVQTKGMYIIKIGTNNILRVSVM